MGGGAAAFHAGDGFASWLADKRGGFISARTRCEGRRAALVPRHLLRRRCVTSIQPALQQWGGRSLRGESVRGLGYALAVLKIEQYAARPRRDEVRCALSPRVSISPWAAAVSRVSDAGRAANPGEKPCPWVAREAPIVALNTSAMTQLPSRHNHPSDRLCCQDRVVKLMRGGIRPRRRRAIAKSFALTPFINPFTS
jgi:hypothetical protein